MRVVKAEVLWSRTCPLNCSYCGMVDGRLNEMDALEWIEGVTQLAKLGCGFIAFYGAEPLAGGPSNLRKLAQVIEYAENIGIKTTVITSGIVPDLRKKLSYLYKYGLRSLTMSVDPHPIDDYARKKSRTAYETLLWFTREHKNLRDIAAVSTLTNKNFRDYPSLVMVNSMLGIWSFFDFFHPDRGQRGSKCRNFPGYKDFLISNEIYNLDELRIMCQKLADMKRQGALLHTSFLFLEKCMKEPEFVTDLKWNCAASPEYPSWLTIDVDGSVLPCDDFTPFSKENKFHITSIADHYEEFRIMTKRTVLIKCPGCAWNTHFDANLIKAGKLPFNDYIHGEGEKDENTDEER